MTLCLYNYYNLELEDIEYKRIEDINDQIASLYKLGSEIYFSDNTELLKELLFGLINLASLLKITKEEIDDAAVEEYAGIMVRAKLKRFDSKGKTLKEKINNQGKTAYLAENCGMENERVYKEVGSMPDEAGYFSLMIVK